jgi:membrane protease YdiL (CAAX protease family)
MSVWRRILLFPLTRLVIWFAAGLLSATVLRLLLKLVHAPGPIVLAGEAGGMFLGLIFLAKVVERRPLRAVGLSPKGILRETLLGFAIGAALLSAVIGTMALAGWYHIGQFTWSTALFWTYLLHYLLVGIQEEIALRGVFFRAVEESLGSYISLGLSALLFGILHIVNPNATLASALAISLEAGVLLAAAYMLTRSLWLAIGIHWGWNFIQGPVFGAAVSGGQGKSLIKPLITGPAWATGGAFGPEGGLIAVLICTLAGVLLLYLAARRGQVVAPYWRRSTTENQVAD